MHNECSFPGVKERGVKLLLPSNTRLRLCGNIPPLRYKTSWSGRVQTERDGTRAETRFILPAKRTGPFISAGVSVQSSTGFLGVRVGGERL